MTHPKVSIVTATWNRGKHLVPTLKSALQQDFQDFEIIVVGDGCTDDTEQVLQPYLSDRLRWINLPHNTGSQAFPNNAGIAAARGEYIAYLGHDDIWDKSHLNHLNVALHGNGAADFCVSGCISYGPLDSNFYRVTGFFERPDDPFVHFVPPSAIMHRRSAVKTSGMWRSPHRVRPPVDADFCLRAAHAGCGFVATGKATVHKFPAGFRYLSYMRQASTEQAEILRQMTYPGYQDQIARRLAAARASGQFMVSKHPDYAAVPPGELMKRTRMVRGIELPDLTALTGAAVISQSDENRGFDWLQREPGKPYRWSGPNPRPKILISHTAPGPVEFTLDLHAMLKDAKERFAVKINDQNVAVTVRPEPRVGHVATFVAHLLPDRHSVIELYAPLTTTNGKPRAIALGDIRLGPLPPRH